MRKLGLIGGTSWHSTVEYYKIINGYVNSYFGDNTNPPLIVYTLNQSLIHQCQVRDEWDRIAELILEAGSSLQKAGAEALMFCANTPHKVYDIVNEQLEVPILHIVDATVEEMKNSGVEKAGFLGTKYSMTEDFLLTSYARQSMDVLMPLEHEKIEELHRIIQQELTYGQILPKSKEYVLSVIRTLVDRGAEGVVLGCTEFPLMFSEDELEIPLFDTTKIHAVSGAKFILGLGDY